MPDLRLMMFDEGFDRGIRCRFINEWFRVDSYASSNEELLAEIEKNRPDVTMIGLDLYGRIDGIGTSRQIRSCFGVPVIYV